MEGLSRSFSLPIAELPLRVGSMFTGCLRGGVGQWGVGLSRERRVWGGVGKGEEGVGRGEEGGERRGWEGGERRGWEGRGGSGKEGRGGCGEEVEERRGSLKALAQHSRSTYHFSWTCPLSRISAGISTLPSSVEGTFSRLFLLWFSRCSLIMIDPRGGRSLREQQANECPTQHPDNHLLKDEGLSPEENILHHLAARLGIQDPIQVDFTEVLLFWLQVSCLHDPHCELGVQSAQVVAVRSATVVEATVGMGWVIIAMSDHKTLGLVN